MANHCIQGGGRRKSRLVGVPDHRPPPGHPAAGRLTEGAPLTVANEVLGAISPLLEILPATSRHGAVVACGSLCDPAGGGYGGGREVMSDDNITDGWTAPPRFGPATGLATVRLTTPVGDPRARPRGQPGGSRRPARRTGSALARCSSHLDCQSHRRSRVRRASRACRLERLGDHRPRGQAVLGRGARTAARPRRRCARRAGAVATDYGVAHVPHLRKLPGLLASVRRCRFSPRQRSR
jgi:hypothetical protein